MALFYCTQIMVDLLSFIMYIDVYMLFVIMLLAYENKVHSFIKQLKTVPDSPAM